VTRNLNSDLMTQIAMGAMFVAVMQMYVVIARALCGRTLGEWTFDLQIGDDREQRRSAYPIRVVMRSVFTVLTGLILLPLLSGLLGRDLAGALSGARLYRQRF
jgi:RDD family